MNAVSRILLSSLASALLSAGCTASRPAPVEVRPPGSQEVVSPEVMAGPEWTAGAAARLEGDLHLRDGRFPEAITAYTRAASAHPYFRRLFFSIAVCYERMGRAAEAVSFYQEYLNANPNGFLRQDALDRIATLRAAAPPPAK
ncbi:MAG: tetratricopeptide repeat protein [Planctomycetes bacterium]|nr:tetratricopeptide repeat protein [Planctomycetota bacterium]